MSIRIDQINIESVGPISDRQLPLKSFNLFYGRNEQGKTFLVEFLLQSLFKNRSGWSLRKVDGRGKVLVSGLNDSQMTFMPSSRTKLEDLLADSVPGLPARLSHLLVVKGAELGFEDSSRDGINKDVLKDYLSGQGLLDVIQGKISRTIQDSEISDGQITGPSRGEKRTRDKLRETLKTIDSYFDTFDSIYSGAERKALAIRREEIGAKIREQELAKRHRAHQLNVKIQKTKANLGWLPRESLAGLDDNFKSLQEAENRLIRQELQLAELREESQHYPWLEEAIPTYESGDPLGTEKTSLFYPAVLLFLSLFAIIFSFMEFPLGTFISLALAIIIGWFAIRHYRTAVDKAVDIEEIKKLEVEFQQRFDRPLSGLPLLRQFKKSMEEPFHGANTLAKQIERDKEELATQRDKIARDLHKLTRKRIAPENWEVQIQKLLQLRNQLENSVNQDEKEIAGLGIAESEYHEAPVAVDYDQEKLLAYTEELSKIRDELAAKEEELGNLKQLICAITHDEISIEWESLMQKLQEEREEIAAQYKKVTANIVAGILINKQLGIIRNQEEEKIRKTLAMPIICEPIRSVTNRYSQIEYENGQLWLVYDYGRYPLNDLSTGAKEQVLLGLRLGFAARLLKTDRLFLVLDDAFQHADWGRRERLLEQIVSLGQDGWQIIYFSMDDHIRDLFNQAGEEFFSDQYQYYELQE